MRGFFGGLIFGLVVALGGAAVLSLSSPLPERPEVGAVPERDGAAAPAPGGESGLGAGAGRDADLVEAAPAAPDAAAGRDDLAPLADADTQPADKPQVGGVAAGPEGPGDAPSQPGVSVVAETPVTPGAAPGDAPPAPEGDSGVAVPAGQPQQPALPDLAETGSGFGADAPTSEPAPDLPSRTSDPQPAGGDSSAVANPGAETAPDPSTDSAAAPTPADAPAVGPATDESSGAPAVAGIDSAPAQPGAALPRPEAAPAPGATPAPDTEPAAAPAEDPAPRIAALPQAGAGEETPRPRVGDPVAPLTERDDPAPEAEAATTPAGPPPIEAHAAEFDRTDDRPMMAIVLIDDTGSIGAEALQEFPYPLTFAVDPAAPDAAEKMARHRAAGFEVVALADLAPTATPQDAEVALSVWMNELPEIVALLEDPDGGVQGNRQLSDQVAAIVGSTGHGLILQDKGLNTAHKLAARAGVPSAVVFRDFDGAGQTPTVIRRFLDQAAFRARQEGAVIMLGRVRPDTISALLLWGLQDRASSVALAPVSAVLLREPG